MKGMGLVIMMGRMGRMGTMGMMGMMGIVMGIKKEGSRKRTSRSPVIKKAVTYSPALHCSTIGAGRLNFSVRDGKRWDPAAIAT